MRHIISHKWDCVLEVGLLTETEPFSALIDAQQQHFSQPFIRFVLWQIQLVEAIETSMSEVSL